MKQLNKFFWFYICFSTFFGCNSDTQNKKQETTTTPQISQVVKSLTGGSRKVWKLSQIYYYERAIAMINQTPKILFAQYDSTKREEKYEEKIEKYEEKENDRRQDGKFKIIERKLDVLAGNEEISKSVRISFNINQSCKLSFNDPNGKEISYEGKWELSQDEKSLSLKLVEGGTGIIVVVYIDNIGENEAKVRFELDLDIEFAIYKFKVELIPA